MPKRLFSPLAAALLLTAGPVLAQRDETPPQTEASIVSGVLGGQGWFRSDVTVSLACSDDESGCMQTWAGIGSNPWEVYTAPVDLALSGDGPHVLRYYSVDNAGNAEPVRLLDVNIDATPPSTSTQIQGVPGSSGWWRSAVTIALEATDGSSGVAATFAGSGFTTGGALVVYDRSTPFDSGSFEGIDTLQFYSVDRAGNEEPLRSLDLRIDLTPPQTAVTLEGTRGENGWWRSPVRVTLAATDEGSGVGSTSFRLNGGTWSTFGEAWFIEPDGHHTVDYYSTDAAGNDEAQQPANISIDATPPSVEIIDPAPLLGPLGDLRIATGRVVAVRAQASDETSGVARVEFSVDGILASTDDDGSDGWSFDWSDAGPGLHRLEAQAVDVSGLSAAHAVDVLVLPG